MKRWGRGLIALLALLLTGCGPLVTDDVRSIDIYATFWPLYALTDALMADVPDATLHDLVQPQDGCLRSYQLSDWDARLLASADAVICGGRGLESFERLLFQGGENGPAVFAALYDLELYEGNAHSDREDSHLDGPNPHIYMSVNGAEEMLEGIAAALASLDPRYVETYAANLERALTALEQLSEDMRVAAGNVAGKPVALMNEALIYTANDLGLNVAAWIERESGGGLYGDALNDCIKCLNASGAKVVLLERQAPAALVDALTAAGFSVAKLDVLSTHAERDGFDIYIEAQLNNARAIGRAFEETER